MLVLKRRIKKGKDIFFSFFKLNTWLRIETDRFMFVTLTALVKLSPGHWVLLLLKLQVVLYCPRITNK